MPKKSTRPRDLPEPEGHGEPLASSLKKEVIEALSVFAGPKEVGKHMTEVPNTSSVMIRCELGDLRRAQAVLAEMKRLK